MIRDCAWASRLSPRSAAPVIATAATARFTGQPPTAFVRSPLGDRSQGPFHEILKAENGSGCRFGLIRDCLVEWGEGPGFEAQEPPLPPGQSRIWEAFKPL